MHSWTEVLIIALIMESPMNNDYCLLVTKLSVLQAPVINASR